MIKSSSLFFQELIDGNLHNQFVAHEKTDIFRDQVVYDHPIRHELYNARSIHIGDGAADKKARIDAIQKVIDKHLPLQQLETAALIDIMLSFRNVGGFSEMLQYIKLLPADVFETVMVQEQYAFALIRVAGLREPVDTDLLLNAENTLLKIEVAGKASSETYGIWGRLYKDKFDRAYQEQNWVEAKRTLQSALTYYKKGFEADIRDAYPGINYITFLELSGEHEQALRIAPVVEMAVRTKMKRSGADYWDHATLLELAVIEKRYREAPEHFSAAKKLVTETWMLQTTKSNLEKINRYRRERGEDTTVLVEIISIIK